VSVRAFGRALGALLSLSSLAHASLTVDRGDLTECPDADAVSRSTQSNARVHVRFERTADGYRATVEFSGAHHGERVLDARGETCAALGDAVVTSISLALEEPAEAPPPANPKESHSETHPFGSLAAGAAAGVTRSIAPIVRAGVGVSRPVGALELGVLWLPPLATAYGPGTVDTSLFALDLRACGALSASAWRPELCAGVAGGALHGRGHGYAIALSNDQTWLAGLVSADARVPIAWGMYVMGRAELLASTRRHSFVVEGLGSAVSTPLLGASLSAGVGLEAR
jgi:hypothetical protein